MSSWKPGQWMLLWRSRGVWKHPVRRLRTLVSFAETEADGGRDLIKAAGRVSDPDLREHLLRHAEDEERHAGLFRASADELRSELAGADGDEQPDKPYDLSRGRGGEVDAHGFFTGGMIEEMGEVRYVAMLHVAEQRAADIFAVHHRLNEARPELAGVFESILKDEKYHVAYTGRFLERWRRAGREREVEEALREARSSRFLGAWKRLGIRSAGGFGRVVLYVLYWTALVPFGLIGRTTRTRDGWRDGQGAASESDLASQY